MDGPWRQDLYHPSLACELKDHAVLLPELLQNEIDDLALSTQKISSSPYDPNSWLNRAHCLRVLGYPELSLSDAYKARLLVEAGLSSTTSSLYGEKALEAFTARVKSMHESNPAWAVHVDTPEKLSARTDGMLRRLEIQCWTELMEGLMAANCCVDYLALAELAVEKFPTDDVFPSELLNARSWYDQRLSILNKRKEAGELHESEMQSTLLNGGVYPVAYPWMSTEILERDSSVLATIEKDFAAVSSNCAVQKSEIRDFEGGKVADVLGVVATRDLVAGETLLTDRTLTGVVGARDRCQTCCGVFPETKVETTCCETKFCSEQCKDDALKYFHKVVCGKDFTSFEEAAETAKYTTDWDIDALLMIRVLALSVQENAEHPLLSSVLSRLTPSYGGSSARLLIFNFQNHIVAPVLMLETLGIDPFTDSQYDMWVIQTARCRLQNNKHGHTLDGSPGTAVSDVYSMFNHNCEANTDWRHPERKSEVEMFCARDVKKGEELCISYIDAGMDREQRVKKLMPWFGCECRCSKCEREKVLSL